MDYHGLLSARTSRQRRYHQRLLEQKLYLQRIKNVGVHDQNNNMLFNHIEERNVEIQYDEELVNLNETDEEIEPNLDNNQSELENIENFDKSISSDSTEILDGIAPTESEFVESILMAFFAYCNLNVTRANLVVNLINDFIKRFIGSQHCLPNARWFWANSTCSLSMEVYILCNSNHSHGPFKGEPKSYGSFMCDNQEVAAELKPGRYFMHLPLREQFKLHLPSISESFWMTADEENDVITDISNAKQAKKAKFQNSRNSTDSHEHKKFTLTLHADEVGAAKSSNIKIFPIYISINELSPPTRRDHFFLAALFVGKKKPLCELFVGTVVEELLNLSESSLTWTCKQTGKTTTATFHLVGLIADAPMRAYLRVVGQFNHISGCDWCRITSRTIRHGARVYDVLKKDEIQLIKRKKRDFMEFRTFYENERRFELNQPKFNGIFRPSPLLNLPDFDIVEGVAVESMHAMALGVFRNIVLKALCEPGYIFSDRGSCNNFTHTLSKRLLQIRVPSSFVRVPRALDEIRLFKSHEYDPLLCYYLLSAGKGLISEQYLKHLALLGKIHSFSHRGPLTESDIQFLEQLIYVFQKGTEWLYGTEFLTYNHHILAHIPDSLRNLGPNSNVSAYPLEDHMGMLKTKVHRYSQIPQALVRVCLNRFKYSEFLAKMSNWNLTEKEKQNFGMNLIQGTRKNQLNVKKFIGPRSVISSFKSYASRLVSQSMLRANQIETDNITLFSTLCLNGVRISTPSYSRGKNRDDTSFATSDGLCYKVQIIFQFSSTYFTAAKRYHLQKLKVKFGELTQRVEFDVENTYKIMSTSSSLELVPIDKISRNVFVIPASQYTKLWKQDHLVDPSLINV